MPYMAAKIDSKAKKTRSISKRCKSGIYVEDVTLEELLQYTHLPASKAANLIGMGITV